MGTRQNRLVEAVLTSSHNLCFGAKIRKIGIPCIPQFCYIEVGFEGIYITRTRFCNVHLIPVDPKVLHSVVVKHLPCKPRI